MSAAVATDVTARREAIEASGWGDEFRLVQPRNAAFWVLVWAMLAGVAGMVSYYTGLSVFAVGLGIGIILFAVYAIPWLLVLTYLNRYTTLPGPMLLIAFLWGALPATYWIALPANNAILSLYAKLFGAEWTASWGAGFTAPISEEIAKALAVIILMGLAPRLVRSAYDGLLLGAFSALGLQISEDVLYAYNATASSFGFDQAGAAFGIFMARAPAGLFQHVLFSIIYCAGLMWLIGRDGGGHRLRGGLLMVVAMVIHSCWDNMIAVGTAIAGGPEGVFVLVPLLAIVGTAVAVWVVHTAARQERRWLRLMLEPETADGLLSEQEVVAASGGYRDRRAYRKSLGERHARRTGKHVLAAALDLAHALARGRGEDTAEVLHARTEVARVRLT